MGFREALNKGIDKEEKKSLKNDFINKTTFEFKSNGKFVRSSWNPESGKWSLSQNSKALTLSASSNMGVNYLKRD
jgi:hypothetical protein